MSGAWGTEAVERAPIEEIPLITEVHIDGLVRKGEMMYVAAGEETCRGYTRAGRRCRNCLSRVSALHAISRH